MTKKESAEAGRALGPEDLGGLAYHLFNEGQAVVDTRPTEAIVWLVQCLRILKQIPQNNQFYTSVFYFIGRALAQLGRNEKAACVLRATVYLNQQEEGETVADNLYATASLFAAIGARALAHDWFQEACRRYETLGRSEQVARCRQEIERTAPQRAEQAARAGTHPVEITLLLEGRVMDRLTVTFDGEVRWQELQSTPYDRPLPVGRNVPWEIPCARL